MDNIWSGRFLPVQKHKAGTHDVYKHFSISYIVDEAEAADYLAEVKQKEAEEGIDDAEFTLEDLTRLGKGRYEWLVGVKFVGDAITYNFMYASNSTDKPSEAEVERHIADYALEVAARARQNASRGNSPGGMFL
jgi:hypothetical protein